MMLIKTAFRVYALTAVVLSGCATVSEDAGFDVVSNTVDARLAKQVHWSRGGPEDQAVADALQDILAEPLTADTAVQTALLNNPRLQATYENLGVAQADLVQAGLLRNPVFHATVLFREDEGDPTLDFSITQELISLFTLPLRKRVAEADFEAAELQVTMVVMDLAAQVRRSFYELQATEQMLEMLQQVVEATGASLELAEQLHQAGNITDLVLSNEQVLHFEARLDLAAVEEAAITARERLNVLLGLWGRDTQWKIESRLPDIPMEPLVHQEAEKRAIENSIDLAAARLRIAGAARRLGLTDATALIPELQIGAAAEREQEDEGNLWKYGPSTELQIPLFDYGQARRARARSDLRRARQEYRALAIEIRAAVRAARRNLQMARRRALFLRDVIVPMRERVVSETLLQYNAMQIGVFQLLQAERQQIRSGAQYIQALRDYWLARARFEQILNGRLGGAGLTDPATAEMPNLAAGPAEQSGGH